ncbi:hypothetical protein [Rhodopirellula bahusiensis]
MDAEVPGELGKPLTIKEITQSGEEIYVHQGRDKPIELFGSQEN